MAFSQETLWELRVRCMSKENVENKLNMTREEYQKECLESFIREEYDSMVWGNNLFTDHVRKMFNAGIQCADTMPKLGLVDLSQVWHPATDKPQEKRQIIAVNTLHIAFGGFYIVNRDILMLHDKCLYISWNTIVCWSYVDDLMPEGGDK